MKNVKSRRGRAGIVTKLGWIRGIADTLERQVVAAKKSHRKIELSPIYANALVAHVADVVSKSYDELPALNVLAAKAAKRA